jgi:hypothetical protein
VVSAVYGFTIQKKVSFYLLLLQVFRVINFLEKYNDKGEVTDTTTLSAEFWDSPDDQYDENSDFTYGDEPITMEKFEKIRDEMYMWMNSDSEFE